MTVLPLIRQEAVNDYSAIADINRRAFAGQVHSDQQEQFLVADLRHAGALVLSLVAEAAGSALGHIAFSPVHFDGKASNWFALAPLAVLPEWQGQGIGSALVDAGLRQLAASGAAGCVVLGEPGYYQRFGFRPGLRCEFAVPPAYFMALPLNENAWPNVSVVNFHPLFSPA